VAYSPRAFMLCSLPLREAAAQTSVNFYKLAKCIKEIAINTIGTPGSTHADRLWRWGTGHTPRSYRALPDTTMHAPHQQCISAQDMPGQVPNPATCKH